MRTLTDNGHADTAYQIATQTPQYRMDSMPDLREMPVISADSGGTHEQLIDNLAHISRDVGPAVASQYDILPIVDTYISAQETCAHRIGARHRGWGACSSGLIPTKRASIGYGGMNQPIQVSQLTGIPTRGLITPPHDKGHPR